MQPIIVIMNFGYAIGGGLITLIFMYFGYKWLDHLTPFDTGEELSKGTPLVGKNADDHGELSLQHAELVCEIAL